MGRTSIRALMLCSGLVLTSFGCSSSDGGASPSGTPMGDADGGGASDLELFSWWVAPGEAEALQALVNTYKGAYPTARVNQFSNTSASDWKMILGDNIAK